MFFKLNSTPVVTIMLASGGTPVTGLAHGDVACFVSKNGAAPSAFTLTAGNFLELSAANMPGLYRIIFTSAALDTLGEWVAVFKDPDDLGTFDQYAAKAYVSNHLFDDIHGRVVTAESTIQGDISSTESTLQGNITSSQVALTSEINVNEGKIDLVNTNLSGFADGLTDIENDIAALDTKFDAAIPPGSELALKSHFVGAGGTESAPIGIGLWDILGDGSVTLGDVDLSLKRVLGLTHENFAIRNQTYDSVNNLVSATVSIHPSALDTTDNTNALAEYTIAATYDSQKRLTSYTMTKN